MKSKQIKKVKLLLVKNKALPMVSCDCCNKQFKLRPDQAARIRKNKINNLLCGTTCLRNTQKAKAHKNLCSIKGCNNHAVVTKAKGNSGLAPRRFCHIHKNTLTIRSNKHRIKDDMCARFMVEPLIPATLLQETPWAREEWFKIIVNELCFINYIRKNNEQYCGMNPGNIKTQKNLLVEEDMFFIDLNLLVSFKRSIRTTDKAWTDKQLKNSSNLFRKNFNKKIRAVSASITNDCNVADMDIIEFLTFLLNDIIAKNKQGKLKLPNGIKTLRKSFNDVINLITTRKNNWDLTH